LASHGTRALTIRKPEPLLLALETATAVTSVALFRGDALLGEVSKSDGSAAETLMPAIDELLGDSGIGAKDLDAIALSIGPGSFTGLRVGLATAKGLAFGAATELVPVSTLAALALTVPSGKRAVLALLDARRGEMYAALFDCSAELPREIVAEGVYTPAELIPRLPPALVVVGEGTDLFGPEIRCALGAGVQLAPGAAAARSVGSLGIRLLARGESVPAAAAVPRYLRRAEAEVMRTGERFEAP
jgi:tRNA threonylcarbamoyladenosine biosynthesis protein TsaB